MLHVGKCITDTNSYHYTQQDIPAGSPVMYVPADLTFTSSKAEQEFGGALSQCEMQLIQAGLQDKVPLFRVFFKVVSEYIKGEEVCVFVFVSLHVSILLSIANLHDTVSLVPLAELFA